MLRLKGTRIPTYELLLQLGHNSLGNRAIPEVVASARLTTDHRATHTTVILHMHALSCCQPIDNQPPKNLLEVIIPPQLPKLTLR
jgi:hypothetical protein